MLVIATTINNTTKLVVVVVLLILLLYRIKLHFEMEKEIKTMSSLVLNSIVRRNFQPSSDRKKFEKKTSRILVVGFS